MTESALVSRSPLRVVSNTRARRSVPVHVSRKGGLLSLAALIAIALLASCGREDTDDRSGALRLAALELVPNGSRVLSTRDGSCIELASSPSCVTSFFRAPARGLEERVAAVRAAGRAGGWDERLVRVGPSCADGRVEDCADNVHVVLAG